MSRKSVRWVSSRDKTKLIIAYHNFGNAAKICCKIKTASTKLKQKRQIKKKTQTETADIYAHVILVIPTLWFHRNLPAFLVIALPTSSGREAVGSSARPAHVYEATTELHPTVTVMRISKCHVILFRESSLLNNLPSLARNVLITSAKEV
jgi:hypothetical protein